jgi:hypothetical protein
MFPLCFIKTYIIFVIYNLCHTTYTLRAVINNIIIYMCVKPILTHSRSLQQDVTKVTASVFEGAYRNFDGLGLSKKPYEPKGATTIVHHKKNPRHLESHLEVGTALNPRPQGRDTTGPRSRGLLAATSHLAEKRRAAHV